MNLTKQMALERLDRAYDNADFVEFSKWAGYWCRTWDMDEIPEKYHKYWRLLQT